MVTQGMASKSGQKAWQAKVGKCEQKAWQAKAGKRRGKANVSERTACYDQHEQKLSQKIMTRFMSYRSVYLNAAK